MNKLTFIFLVIITSPLISQESIGKDSGSRDIMMYANNSGSDTALIVIGGIHGDEFETVDTIYYIKNNLKTDISTYFIPTINPTLTSPSVRTRGYIRDQLDSNGILLNKSNANSFNKELYYRIFYGNEKTYKQGIDNFVDPNRDFINQILPSTKALTAILLKLSNKYNKVILISLHGYMNGGRIYPEYIIVDNSKYKLNSTSWEYAKKISEASGFQAEEMYSPAISILERFKGELITYTTKFDNLYGIDIELNNNNRSENSKKVLNGIQNLLNYISRN